METKTKMVPVPKMKKLNSGTGTEINQLNKAFTLVELIVVITILAILATIGFVSFSGYLAGTRDTNRVAQLKSMSDALELYRTKKDLPIPDDKIDIKTDTKTIAYQGYIGKNVLETIEYTESGLDPKDKQYFSYYLTKNKKYFQLLAFLEEPNTDVVALNTFNNSFATDYLDRYPKTTGKKLGILTDLNNTPIQEISEIGGESGSGYLNIINTNNEYKAIFKEGEIIQGTGGILNILELTNILGGKININSNGYAVFSSKGNWNYKDEFGECIDIELFDNDKIKKIEKVFNLGYNNYKIESDLEFLYRGDDSTPKHYLYGKKLSDFNNYNLHLNFFASDNTELKFIGNNFTQLKCEGLAGSTACGTNGLPNRGDLSESILIYKIKFQPICEGATAYLNDFYRNQFTFKGTFYNLLLKK